jgi:hypothetical protein
MAERAPCLDTKQQLQRRSDQADPSTGPPVDGAAELAAAARGPEPLTNRYELWQASWQLLSHRAGCDPPHPRFPPRPGSLRSLVFCLCSASILGSSRLSESVIVRTLEASSSETLVPAARRASPKGGNASSPSPRSADAGPGRAFSPQRQRDPGRPWLRRPVHPLHDAPGSIAAWPFTFFSSPRIKTSRT